MMKEASAVGKSFSGTGLFRDETQPYKGAPSSERGDPFLDTPRHPFQEETSFFPISRGTTIPFGVIDNNSGLSLHIQRKKGSKLYILGTAFLYAVLNIQWG